MDTPAHITADMVTVAHITAAVMDIVAHIIVDTVIAHITVDTDIVALITVDTDIVALITAAVMDIVAHIIVDTVTAHMPPVMVTALIAVTTGAQAIMAATPCHMAVHMDHTAAMDTPCPMV